MKNYFFQKFQVSYLFETTRLVWFEGGWQQQQKIIFFKSIKCHTFSEPQARFYLNDNNDNDNDDDNDDEDDDDINDNNKEEDDDDKKLFFFKSINCHTFLEPQARSDLNEDDDNEDDDDNGDNNTNNIDDDDNDDKGPKIIRKLQSISCCLLTDINDVWCS